jgi:hypothetical protein
MSLRAPVRAVIAPLEGAPTREHAAIRCPQGHLVGYVVSAVTEIRNPATTPPYEVSVLYGVVLELGAGAIRLPEHDRDGIPAVGLRPGAFQRGGDPVRHPARNRRAAGGRLTRSAGQPVGILMADGGVVWPLRLDTWCPATDCHRRLFVNGNTALDHRVAIMV